MIEWRFGQTAIIDRLSAAGWPTWSERKVDVIVVRQHVAALAAKRATRTIPIVMAPAAIPWGCGPGAEPRTSRRKRHRVSDA